MDEPNPYSSKNNNNTSKMRVVFHSLIKLHRVGVCRARIGYEETGMLVTVATAYHLVNIHHNQNPGSQTKHSCQRYQVRFAIISLIPLFTPTGFPLLTRPHVAQLRLQDNSWIFDIVERSRSYTTYKDNITNKRVCIKFVKYMVEVNKSACKYIT